MAEAAHSQVYRRRRPERSVAYRALTHHFEGFLQVYEDRFEPTFGYLPQGQPSALLVGFLRGPHQRRDPDAGDADGDRSGRRVAQPRKDLPAVRWSYAGVPVPELAAQFAVAFFGGSRQPGSDRCPVAGLREFADTVVGPVGGSTTVSKGQSALRQLAGRYPVPRPYEQGGPDRVTAPSLSWTGTLKRRLRPMRWVSRRRFQCRHQAAK